MISFVNFDPFTYAYICIYTHTIVIFCILPIAKKILSGFIFLGIYENNIFIHLQKLKFTTVLNMHFEMLSQENLVAYTSTHLFTTNIENVSNCACIQTM